MRTSPSARNRDTPAFQHNQCSGDWMPGPTHPSAASSSRTAATKRATAVLTVPITTAASASATRHATSWGDGPGEAGGGGSDTTDMPATVTTGYDTLRSVPDSR